MNKALLFSMGYCIPGWWFLSPAPATFAREHAAAASA